MCLGSWVWIHYKYIMNIFRNIIYFYKCLFCDREWRCYGPDKTKLCTTEYILKIYRHIYANCYESTLSRRQIVGVTEPLLLEVLFVCFSGRTPFQIIWYVYRDIYIYQPHWGEPLKYTECAPLINILWIRLMFVELQICSRKWWEN